MNLIDCFVTEITGPPRELYGRWWLPVKYVAEGWPGNTEIMCDSLEEAESIVVGYVFLS